MKNAHPSIRPTANPERKDAYQGKLISETIPNGLFTIDQEWIIQSWNAAAGSLLGVRAADVIGQPLWEVFAGRIPLTFYTAYHQASPADIPVYFECYWPAMETWYEAITCYSEGVLAVSFKNKYPPVYKHSAEHLKTIYELYQFMTRVTNDCLWEWDLRNKEIFWIDGCHKRAFGYPIENALVPQTFWETRIHPADKARVLKTLHKIITTGKASTWEEEYRLQKADGNYAYVCDRGHIFYEDGKACRMIGATQDISVRKLAQQQLSETETQLLVERLSKQTAITHAVLKAQEQERATIGTELHDNLNQVLGAAKLYIDMAKTDETIRDLCLDKSSAFIVQVIEDIRKIAKSLIPPIMMMGLEDSVKHLLQDLKLTHAIEINFREEDFREHYLDEKLKMAIFRIIQEQLSNIIKHSQAKHASINLSMTEANVVLLMSDDGQGCDIAAGTEGIGIRNIISRTELYHGSVSIESKSGKGFALKALFPLSIAI